MSSTKPPIIQQIEKIVHRTLHPASPQGIDPAGNVVRARLDLENDLWLCQYVLLDDGQTLAGLNLMGRIITDKEWQKITALPDFKPEHLQALNLRGNFLKKSPLSTGMTNLRYLDLCDNQLEELAFPESARIPEFIFLSGNEGLKTPPPEIVSQGRFEIRKYFEELAAQGDEVVYEAKLLILGDAGAGKTTLARKIADPDAPMPREVEDSTDGIVVTKLPLTGQNPTFLAHIWDFGGQEVYHATHQFFLTRRSLYVLLCDGRKEEQFDYWLQAQELYGLDSRLLLVVNQKGTMEAKLPMSDLRRDYPNIAQAEPTVINLKTDRDGAVQLHKKIETTIRNLPQFERGERVPRLWAAIRRHLEGLEVEHITLEKFRGICSKEGIPERDRQDFLLDFLHNLGAFLHFKEVAGLNKMVILKPEWATNAVYKVLDHTRKKGQDGHFTKAELKRVWDCGDYLDYFEELLALMERFELCYQTPENPDLYIVPSLLPEDSPKGYEWVATEGLETHYQYTFLPKGIMARLIVRQHQLLENQPVMWKRGAVFHLNGVRAEVLESHRDKRISIRTNSSNRAAKELLRDLVSDLGRLNATFHFNERMTVEQQIPCNCPTCKTATTPHYFKRSELDRAEQAGAQVQCSLSFTLIPVQQVLDGIFPTESVRGLKEESRVASAIPRAFISYSKHDIEFLKAFKKHLNPLVRNGQIQLWDDLEILPGEEWDPAIRTALGQAEIIFLLLSVDFLNTNYVLDIEIAEALRRHGAGTAKVIPIKMKPCYWKNMPFGKLQGLPRKDALIERADNDHLWLTVVEEIEALLSK